MHQRFLQETLKSAVDGPHELNVVVAVQRLTDALWYSAYVFKATNSFLEHELDIDSIEKVVEKTSAVFHDSRITESSWFNYLSLLTEAAFVCLQTGG